MVRILVGVFTSPVFSSAGLGGERQPVVLRVSDSSGHAGGSWAASLQPCHAESQHLTGH